MVQFGPTRAPLNAQRANVVSLPNVGISTNQFDTKFNIVVFGVDECSIGTNRLVRHNSDLNSVASITTSMVILTS